MKEKALIQAAAEARKQAYAPYSGFKVGAALLTADQKIYVGCNMENAAYSPSLCAERAAFAAAIGAGERAFSAIAIIAGEKDYCVPCGVCRQVMAEFCEEDFLIIAAKTEEDYRKYRLKELIPHGFCLE